MPKRLRSPACLVPILLLAGPAAARAHALDMAALEIALEGEQLEERLSLSVQSFFGLVAEDSAAEPDGAANAEALAARMLAATLGADRPQVDGKPCTLADPHVTRDGTSIALTARGRCPAGTKFHQKLGFLSSLSRGHRVVVQADLWGRRAEAIADADAQVLAFERGREWGLGALVALGVEHIFTGWDHLVFLLGLILAGGSVRRLLLVVTSFTVAHSITLGLAALSIVQLPGRLVESAIAASIMVVALENFLGAGGSRRWAIAFAFGLVHGFGFASALAETGLGETGLLRTLFGFNLGVEVGQATLVLAVAPLLAFARRHPGFARHAVPALSLASLALGAYWFVGRAFPG